MCPGESEREAPNGGTRRSLKKAWMADREIFASAKESNRERFGGFVEDSRTKTQAKSSDRAPKDFFNGLLESAFSKNLRRGEKSMSALLFLVVLGAFAVDDPPPVFGRFLVEIRDLREPHAVTVAPNGILYITDTGNHRVRAFSPQGVEWRQWGSWGQEPGEFCFPAGIAADAGGRIYVADSGNHRIQVFRSTGEFERTLPSQGFELRWPGRISVDQDRLVVVDRGNRRLVSLSLVPGDDAALEMRPDNVSHPCAVTIAPGGGVFVSDSNRHQILQLDSAGQPVASWAGYGSFPGLLSSPQGIAFAHGQLYVTDSHNHRIQRFAMTGQVVDRWGLHELEPHVGEGRLHYPCDVAVAPNGQYAVVAEAFEDRCQVFLPGEDTSEEAGIVASASVHYGPSIQVSGQRVVVSDLETHQLLLFELEDQDPLFLGRIGRFGERFAQLIRPQGFVWRDDGQEVLVCDTGNQRLQRFRVVNHPDGRNLPGGIGKFVAAVDLSAVNPDGPRPVEAVAMTEGPDGHLYILDAWGSRILVLDEKLGFVKEFGESGTGPNQFLAPTDLAVAANGEELLVVDAGNRRVVRCDREGRVLGYLGSPSGGLGEGVLPRGIHAAADGSVYLTDAGRHRVMKWTADGELEREWGGIGLRAGSFFKPHGVSQDGTGRLFVLDFGNHRCQVFTEDGEFVTAFGAEAYVGNKGKGE